MKFVRYIAIGVAVLAVGFFAFNRYIYRQKQGTGKVSAPYRATLTGEFTCLPHRDSKGPQTLECAFGLKTASGEYYALGFSSRSTKYPDMATGKKITVTGTVIPRDAIQDPLRDKYPIEGVMEVTEPVREE